MQQFSSRFDTLPEGGENWFPMHNRMMLTEVLKTLPPGSKVLEIGSWLGRSACFILEVNPNVDLYCLDIWKDDRLPEDQVDVNAEKLYNQFVANLTQLGILDKISVIKDSSRNVLEYFEEDTLDLIYIDGSHEEEDVYHDLHNAYKLLKMGGHVVGDDWNWNSVSKGLMRAFWEINKDKELLYPIRTFVTAYHTFKYLEKD